MSQPEAVSSAICCRVALMSVVGVVVIDCTRDRGVAADADLADLDLAGLAARGERRAAGCGHAQVDGHDAQYRAAGGTVTAEPWLSEADRVDDVGVR